MSTQTVQSLEELLKQSSATEEFKNAVRALEAGKKQDRIVFSSGNPPVKALRFCMKLLEEMPNVAIESVSIDGSAGCSDYSGSATVQPGDRKVYFVWDCKWRAEQMGWEDAVGYPDQIRAAREFGYQCFEKFETA